MRQARSIQESTLVRDIMKSREERGWVNPYDGHEFHPAVVGKSGKKVHNAMCFYIWIEGEKVLADIIITCGAASRSVMGPRWVPNAQVNCQHCLGT